MANRILVTGFGPFEGVKENPSEILARGCGRDHRIIEVSYQAVSEFIRALDSESFDTLLLLGVHGRSKTLKFETVARNALERRKDARGHIPNQRKIRPDCPDAIEGTLWPLAKLDGLLAEHNGELSDNAGGYLCNFIYYEALLAFPEKKIGFLHVPLPRAMPITAQHKAISSLLAVLEGTV